MTSHVPSVRRQVHGGIAGRILLSLKCVYAFADFQWGVGQPTNLGRDHALAGNAIHRIAGP